MFSNRLMMVLFGSSRLCLPGQHMSNAREEHNNSSCSSVEAETKTTRYLTGVLGLPGNFRGERTFGSKENFSLTFSSTDGATYVKPWGGERDLSPPLQTAALQKQLTADDEQ